MSGFEMTPEERENWREHNRRSKQLSAALKTSTKVKRKSKTSYKRKQEAVSLFLESRSLGHVCSTLRMGKDTLKNILKEQGVPY